jgi:3-phenylpropionate/trans-cinnamate dioxygenase ferredoxin reductase component
MAFVIVGAGLAGANAAQTLRADGYTDRLVLIGEEDVRPYERPPLSKGLLLGTSEREQAFVHSAQWYGENNVEFLPGVRVTALDRTAQSVILADGTRVPYDRLLLCTGSRPRQLPIPGADLDHVLSLRTMADSDRLGARLTDGARVVVIGAGWIGLEVAAAARLRGADVTVLEAAGLPLQRVLGDEVATVFRDLHAQRGVTFHFGASVQEIAPDAVVLADGTRVPADTVLVGVGVEPNIELARDAGLTVANGVVTDVSLCTSDPHVFAAGDVANSRHPLIGQSLRVEHWDNAIRGGKAAARAMLGQPVVYDNLPYFYTDQYDLGMEYAGYVAPGGYDSAVFRGDPSVVEGKTPEFLVFWQKNGRVLAGMNVNIWDVQDDIQALVRAGHAGRAVDLAKLADPSITLTDLIT